MKEQTLHRIANIGFKIMAAALVSLFIETGIYARYLPAKGPGQQLIEAILVVAIAIGCIAIVWALLTQVKSKVRELRK